MALFVGQPERLTQCMAAVLAADKTRDYLDFCKRIEDCARAGILFTCIEAFLRRNNCMTYLIARPHEGIVSRFPCMDAAGAEKPYFVFCAMHPQAKDEIENYEENLNNLDEAGILEPQKLLSDITNIV